MSCLAVISTLLWLYISKLQRKWKITGISLTITLAALAGLIFYGANFKNLLETDLFTPAFAAAMVSLSWLFQYFLAFPVLLILAILVSIIRRKPPLSRGGASQGEAEGAPSMTRRTFLKGVAAGIPLLALGTSTYGIVDGEKDLTTTELTLHFPNLPDYLRGYRIAQISDTHMGMFFSPQRLQESLDAAIKAGADHLVLTGDLIDELSLLPKYRDILNAAAPHFPGGIDFVYGNHEYYRGLTEITAMLEETPVRILRNSHYQVAAGGRPFYIAGVDYSFTKGDDAFRQEREKYVTKALEGIPNNAFTILLAHHSLFLDEGFAHNVDLTMAGHTHGGQFAPMGWFIQTVGFKYLRGLYERDHHYGYVNRGTGHWLPLRIGCSREITIYELRAL